MRLLIGCLNLMLLMPFGGQLHADSEPEVNDRSKPGAKKKAAK